MRSIIDDIAQPVWFDMLAERDRLRGKLSELRQTLASGGDPGNTLRAEIEKIEIEIGGITRKLPTNMR